MIIWGSRGREHLVGHGNFHCPACQRPSSYSLKRVSRYFTLYFIPLFQTSTLGEYVTCDSCGSAFEPQVLSMAQTTESEKRQPWQCPTCHNHNPADSSSCLRCRRWFCANCGRDNPSDSGECLLCRSQRGL
ncbi:MAG: zinc-ribbon domain-containing protein [Planctomycetales bacterium]|nr:zinc-ribbon domain-containing protein [Planctomycetales bacterium]